MNSTAEGVDDREEDGEEEEEEPDGERQRDKSQADAGDSSSLSALPHVRVGEKGGRLPLEVAREVHVHRDELRAAATGLDGGVFADELTDAARWKVQDREYQIDAGIHAVASPGHTAGHMSLLLTLPHAGRYFGLMSVAVCGVIWLGIRQLRYAEFGLASRLLFGGELQRTLGGQIKLERLAEEMGQADDEEQCWRLVSAAAQDFGFDSLRLSLRGTMREQPGLKADASECWSLRVPVGEDDYFELTRRFESGVLPMMVAPFLDTLRRALEERLEQWDQPTVNRP